MILEIIVLLLAFPAGYLIAWLAKDELIEGRKWFYLLIVLSLVVGIVAYFRGWREIAWTARFAIIISLVSLVKSKDKKWTKVRK